MSKSVAREHRELYPEQYAHPLVGKTVEVRLTDPVRVFEGKVERVVSTRFGQLVILVGEDDRTAYGIGCCTEKA